MQKNWAETQRIRRCTHGTFRSQASWIQHKIMCIRQPKLSVTLHCRQGDQWLDWKLPDKLGIGGLRPVLVISVWGEDGGLSTIPVNHCTESKQALRLAHRWTLALQMIAQDSAHFTLLQEVGSFTGKYFAWPRDLNPPPAVCKWPQEWGRNRAFDGCAWARGMWASLKVMRHGW